MKRMNPKSFTFREAQRLGHGTCYASLKNGGVLSVQADGQWFHCLYLNGDTQEIEAATCDGKGELLEVVHSHGQAFTQRVWVPAQQAHRQGQAMASQPVHEHQRQRS